MTCRFFPRPTGLLGILVITLLMVTGSAFPQIAVPPAAGDGLTTDTAYQITELANLVWLQEWVLAHQTQNAYFKLMNDIDASETATWNDLGTDTDTLEGFRPICGPWKFCGVFDGMGHRITGLTINRSYMEGIGLFGYTEVGSEIRNLEVDGVSINGKAHVGALIGTNWGAVTNCSSSGTISGQVSHIGGLIGSAAISSVRLVNCQSTCQVSGGSQVGGLLGSGINLILNCEASGSVSGSGNLGGLVGQNNGGEIINCHATGQVTGDAGLGGLVGSNTTSGLPDHPCVILNSYATGNVVATTYNAGGLVGRANTTRIISNCYATGDVTCLQGNEVGGLIGRFENSEGKSVLVTNSYAAGAVRGRWQTGGLIGVSGTSAVGTISKCYAIGPVTADTGAGGLIGDISLTTVTASYWDLERSGQAESDGGVGKTTAEMKQRATYQPDGGAGSDDWDFQTVWGISPRVNSGYPFLRVFVQSATVSWQDYD